MSKNTAGFTLMELVIAMFAMLALITVAMGAYTSGLRHAQESSEHITQIDEARAAEQNIVKVIQRGRAVSATASELTIVMPDGKTSRLRLVDQDSDAETVEDNVLEYDADTATSGDEIVLCKGLSAIPGEQMFQIVPTSPRTALISFHVGEIPPSGGEVLMTAEGYQGVEVRVSATPRNLGTVYVQ